ncbi:MAG: hypothetical protein R3F49_04145 [Planctomycetota bacterium]
MQRPERTANAADEVEPAAAPGAAPSAPDEPGAPARRRTPEVRLPRWGDRLEVTFERLDDKGHGVGTIARGEDGECEVRVRGALPGARCGVTVVARRRRMVDAKIVEVLAPAPAAVAPRCPHFGPCGGCSFQHLGYEAQLELKRARVATALRPC